MLSKEDLFDIFFIKEKNNRFNDSLYRSLSNDDYRRYSLDHFYNDSNSIQETYIRLRNNWDIIPTCPVCGKKLKWIKSKLRFQNHCSSSCALKDPNVQEKRIQTCLKKYGYENNSQNLENKEKVKQTCLKKYGVTSPLCNGELRDKGIQTKIKKYNNLNYNNPEKTTSTCFKKYGSGRNYKAIEKTMIERYGKKSYLSTDYINNIRNSKEIQEKIQNSLRKNNTLNSSKMEIKSFELLKQKYPDVIHQYKDNRYPFNCDFYIPSLDLFIECQYGQFHHGRPYLGTEEDLNDIEILKENNIKRCKYTGKQKSRYLSELETWTIRDVKKRNIAKENKLNYVEVFTIEELKNFINKII